MSAPEWRGAPARRTHYRFYPSGQALDISGNEQIVYSEPEVAAMGVLGHEWSPRPVTCIGLRLFWSAVTIDVLLGLRRPARIDYRGRK